MRPYRASAFEIGQRFTACKDKITIRRQTVHRFHAFFDGFQGKARAVCIFFLIDAERAVVLAVIRYKDRDRRTAFSRLIREGLCRCGQLASSVLVIIKIPSTFFSFRRQKRRPVDKGKTQDGALSPQNLTIVYSTIKNW